MAAQCSPLIYTGGGGGTCEGLQRAGFDVVGIDNNPLHKRNYPGEFICADALDPPLELDDFDLIWSSPPCQRYSTSTPAAKRARHPDLINLTQRLIAGHPYTCIENVAGAPIRHDLTLTGPMFGLGRIMRRRFFELSWFFLAHPPQKLAKGTFASGRGVEISTSLSASNHFYPRKAHGLPGRVPKAEALEVMGITHDMTVHQIGEAVPPAYAEYIGRAAIHEINLQKTSKNVLTTPQTAI